MTYLCVTGMSVSLAALSFVAVYCWRATRGERNEEILDEGPFVDPWDGSQDRY